MMRDEDIEFHTPVPTPWEWGETTFFAFSIPEERLFGEVYVLTRKGIGAMLVEVLVSGALSNDRAGLLYLDCHSHLPVVDRLSDFETVNGLRLKATDLKNYQVDYVGSEGMELHFAFKGLMEPFDIHDPAMNPLAHADAAGPDQYAMTGAQEAYANHYDMTGTIVGTLKLHGREYRIDCVDTMDHSWGRRRVYDFNPVGWMHAHFDRDLAIHWISLWDIDRPNGSNQSLANGYVMDGGEVHALVDIEKRVTRIDRMATSLDVKATDRRGKIFRLHGTVEAAVPHIQYNSIEMRSYLIRWTLDDGRRIGHGVSMEGVPISVLARRYGRRWTEERDGPDRDTRITW